MSSVAHRSSSVASPARHAAHAFGVHGVLADGVVPCAAMMMITTIPISVT